MAISTIRKFTDSDQERLEKAAKRFCKKRNIAPCVDEDRWGGKCVSYYDAVYLYLDACHDLDKSYEEYSWTKALARALKESYVKNLTIGYGYVGIHVKS